VGGVGVWWEGVRLFVCDFFLFLLFVLVYVYGLFYFSRCKSCWVFLVGCVFCMFGLCFFLVVCCWDGFMVGMCFYFFCYYDLFGFLICRLVLYSFMFVCLVLLINLFFLD